MVSGRGDEGERVTAGALGIAARALPRWDVVGHGIEPLLRDALGEELALPGRRGEPALREGRVGIGHAQTERPFPLEVLEGETGQVRMLPAQGLPRHLFVGLAQGRMIEAHSRGQQPEHVRVGLGLAEGRDGRPVQAHVEMAVRLVDVVLLERGRGGQDDVGVVDGVGLEEVVDHREEVLARETLADLLALRRHRQRVRVVDEHGLHGRSERGVEQDPSDLAHVEQARPRGREVRSLQGGGVGREGAGAGEQDAAPGMAPGPGDGGQAGDRAHGHARARMTIEPVVQADRYRLPGRALARQPLDVGRGQPRRLRHPRRVPLAHALAQGLGADRVALEVVAILETVPEDDVHQPQGQRAVRPRQEREVAVGLLRGARAEGVDGHEGRPAAPRLLDEGPEVDVGAHDVRAPGHDEARVHHRLRIEAHGLAQRGLEPLEPRAGADRPIQAAGPQRVEEAAVHAAEREEAHVAGVRVGQDGLRAVLRHHAVQAIGDEVQGFVPRDASEAALALASHALHRVQDAVGAVDPLQVVIHLHAEEALGEAVVGIATDPDGAAVLDVHGHDAGVRAVVRTDDLERAASRGARHDLGAHRAASGRIGVGFPLPSTATSTTSASVTFTFSPWPPPHRSASTLTRTVIDVRPTRTVSV